MISDETRRQWAVKASNQPRLMLINFIIRLGRERDHSKSMAKEWQDIAERVSRKIPSPEPEFEAHLRDGNEVDGG